MSDRPPQMSMNCPKCHSHSIRKNGHRRGKQNDQCKSCGRQFIEYYSEVGYSQRVKEDCLTMYLNGNGFRAIERITKVNQNTVIRDVTFVNQATDLLSKREKYFSINLSLIFGWDSEAIAF